MGELIINKLVFYSKNSMRIRFKILNLIRGMILKFYNPIVKVQIGDKLLYMNFSVNSRVRVPRTEIPDSPFQFQLRGLPFQDL